MATKEGSQVGVAVIELFDKLTHAFKVKAWYASKEDCPPIAHDLIEEEIEDTVQAIRKMAYERSLL